MNEERQMWVQKPAVVVCLALLCCALWGSAIPAIKIGYQLFHIEGAGSQILFAGYRFFGAGILTFLMASIMEKRVIRLKRSSIAPVFGQGVLQTTLQYVFFYLGVAHTTGTKSSVINAASVFFAIFVAHFLVKGERATPRKILGCLIGFAGVIVINLAPGGWDSNFSFLGEGMILLAAFAYGTSSVTVKLVSQREHPTTVTAYQLLFGGALLLLIGVLSGGRVTGFTLRATLVLCYMSLLTTVAFSIWATLLKYNPVSRVTIFSFSIPVFGVLFSALFLQEKAFSVQNLIALVLVIIGIVFVNTGSKAAQPDRT